MPFASKTYDELVPYTVACELGGGTDGSSPIYLGRAPIGTLKSESKWQIQKITYSGDGVTDIQWAAFTGHAPTNDFDKKWDDRATYTYS